MTTSPARLETPEPLTRRPPRYWWMKRIALGFVALLVLMLGVRLIWGRIAQQKLQAARDDLAARASGMASGVNSPPLPELQNAATFFLRAERLIASDSPAMSNLSYAGYPHFPPGVALR